MCAVLLLYVLHLRREMYKIRPSYKLLKDDLNTPAESAWRRVRDLDSDRGYVIYTTFTRAAFDKLYREVYPSDYLLGRPPVLPHRDYLAMTLFYLHSVSSLNIIASLFNCSLSTCSRQIRATLERLENGLKSVPEARIEWPSPTQCEDYALLILHNMNRKGNQGCYVPGWPIGFMDGCNFPVLRHHDHRIADRYYATWKRKHTVSNLLVWAPDGTIIHAYWNAPGATPDSTIASRAYELMHTLPPQYTLLADCAFARQGGRIVTTQAKELLSNSQWMRDRNKEIASQRVAAEWGNAGLLGAWLRLTRALPTNDQHRRRIIGVCLSLHNFRARVDNISQILTVYDQRWCGNWRRGTSGFSNAERYIESVRLRADRVKQKAAEQQAKLARRAVKRKAAEELVRVRQRRRTQTTIALPVST